MARKYDREFKVEAIRMASEEGRTAVEVERRLGISVGIISRWKKRSASSRWSSSGRIPLHLRAPRSVER